MSEKEVLDQFAQLALKKLGEGTVVTIRGFGRFGFRDFTYKNPHTQLTETKQIVNFTAFQALKDVVSRATPKTFKPRPVKKKPSVKAQAHQKEPKPRETPKPPGTKSFDPNSKKKPMLNFSLGGKK
jgi:nucleoid DNA-binding protein